MAGISINNLTFGYDGATENIFEDVSFNLDTKWKLGLIGRNGKGKTTFLKLLLGEYEYSGSITKNVDVDYFPFEVNDTNRITMDVISDISSNIEDWQIMKELNLLETDIQILYRPFNTLSGGEQVKVLLAALFAKSNNFLLIDEPTNHLDVNTKNILTKYLNKKNGYILVSHDRRFLNDVVDHIISINNTNIEIIQGNFSVWKENKERQDNFELTQNEKLERDIARLKEASKSSAEWSNKAEKSKYKTENPQPFIDRGFIGHKAAKMMKKAKVMEQRIQDAIEQKSGLLKNIDRNEDLKIVPKQAKRNTLILANKLQIKYGDKEIFKPVTFEINNKDRVAIIGKNGIGKSSLLKLIIGEDIQYTGEFNRINDLKISYVAQSTEGLKGNLKEFARDNKIEESIFKAMLTKMGFSRQDFETEIQLMSEGEKKKVLIAKSISEQANIYVWDEPLNYIDVLTRMQLEQAILKCMPTIVFVEHDETFVKNIATKIIELEK